MFIYSEVKYERTIMMYFDGVLAKEMKGMIDDFVVDNTDEFRKNVFKRILNFQNKKKWWIENWQLLSPADRIAEQDELIAIWKIGIKMMYGFYASEIKSDDEGKGREDLRGVNKWFQQTLCEAETDLENGIINENEYLIICNNMKTHKKDTEDLLTVCGCSVIAAQAKGHSSNNPSHQQDLFRIICMPCGF
jgi:hypothetical protein